MRDIVQDCYPKDAFSSCEDLLKREALPALMLLLGIAAFIGNVVVIITHKVKNNFTVQSILITSLAASDLLMAVYMIIIAGADIHYRGRYIRFVDDWKGSFLCSFLAGSISTLSSECSVTILMLLSVDRAINIVFPFNTKKLSTKSCKIIIGVVWLVVVIISFLPACNYFNNINIPYFGDNYGRQSVCLALPLTRSRKAGWEYAIAIFIAFNFFSFIVIAASYIAIFISAWRLALDANRSMRRAEDIRMAIKLALIILTDFCCWFPIILMGIVSEAGGWDLPEEIYVWSATFIIPINSSINPYLFAVAYMCKDACTNKSKAVHALQMHAIQRATVKPALPSQIALVKPASPGQPAVVQPALPSQIALVKPASPGQPAVVQPASPGQPAPVQPSSLSLPTPVQPVDDNSSVEVDTNM